MKRFALALCLALSMQPIAAFAAPDPVPAPADEYFGAYHLSVLGIRNTLSDLASAPADQAPRVYRKLIVVEDAVEDWRQRFPADPWLPKMGLRVGLLFGRLGVLDSFTRERDVLNWICQDFPMSKEGELAANALEDDDPNAPLAAYASAPQLAPASAVPTASYASDPASAPMPAPPVAAAPGPQQHNVTAPVVAGVAVAGAAAWLLLRHKH